VVREQERGETSRRRMNIVKENTWEMGSSKKWGRAPSKSRKSSKGGKFGRKESKRGSEKARDDQDPDFREKIGADRT